MKKKPLGRGLSNLLVKAEETPSAFLNESSNYQEIPLDAIHPSEKQPRKIFNEKEIEGLAETIISIGLIEPIVLRKINQNNYELIAGERRYRAVKKIGFKKIPAIIKEANELQAIEMGIIENIQREGLNPIEEAQAYENWIELTKQKIDVLAKKIGKNRSTVKNLIRLLKLPAEVRELIEKKQIAVGQARPLLAIGDKKKLIQLAMKISKEGWNTRKVEDQVAQLTEGLRPIKFTKEKIDPNLTALEKKLRIYLSAKVELQHKGNNSGKISIYYTNLDELDRLLEKLNIN